MSNFNRSKWMRNRSLSPKLKNNQTRVTMGVNLPPEMAEGIKNIADYEECTISWVIEQIVAEFFGLKYQEIYKK